MRERSFDLIVLVVRLIVIVPREGTSERRLEEQARDKQQMRNRGVRAGAADVIAVSEGKASRKAWLRQVCAISSAEDPRVGYVERVTRPTSRPVGWPCHAIAPLALTT